MAKPAITTRTGKGSPLDYAELDTNFENLRDATLTVTDGTNSTAIDLNGTLEFTAGANMTVTESNGVVTLASSSGFAPDPVSGDYEFDGSDLDLNGGTILNDGGNIVVGDDINFPDDHGPAVLTTGGNLLVRGGVDGDGTITLDTTTVVIGNSGTNDNVAIDTAGDSKGLTISKGTKGNGNYAEIVLGTSTGQTGDMVIAADNDLDIELRGVGTPSITLNSTTEELVLNANTTGGLAMYQASMSATPSNTSTVQAWLKVTVGTDTSSNSVYYIPLYQ